MNRLMVPVGIAVRLNIGCSTVASKSIDIGVLPPPYNVVVNGVGESVGESVGEREIAAGSYDAQRISDWLAANQTGWVRKYVTMLPEEWSEVIRSA